MSLDNYHKKRDFKKTSEPKGKSKQQSLQKTATAKRKMSLPPHALSGGSNQNIFVIQKHHARNLHYDFRLEIDGTLKSWAVPKGPSKKPADKRLAIMTEDHPLKYADFEGVIPEGQYGAGKVEIWDKGTWEPIGDMKDWLKTRKLEFTLNGKKLKGDWVLIGLKNNPKNWLLIKKKT